jgi:outer membrane protein TolC
LAAAKAASRQIRRSRLELEKQLAAQRLELNRLLGLAPSAELVVATPNLPTRFEPPSKSSLSREIERRRPDLLALRRGYQSQQAAVRAAILGQFPKIDIGVVHDRDSDNIKTAGFQVGIDLPVFDRNQGRIAAERATRQKLRDEYADRVFRARSDVAMLCGGIGFLNRQIAELRAANADFQNLADTYARALKAGRADAMAAFDARIRLAENRRNEIASRGQLAEAICALELASGIYQLR